jgi:hypothetical protein
MSYSDTLISDAFAIARVFLWFLEVVAGIAIIVAIVFLIVGICCAVAWFIERVDECYKSSKSGKPSGELCACLSDALRPPGKVDETV